MPEPVAEERRAGKKTKGGWRHLLSFAIRACSAGIFFALFMLSPRIIFEYVGNNVADRLYEHGAGRLVVIIAIAPIAVIAIVIALVSLFLAGMCLMGARKDPAAE
jgi:hypothetical protein